MNKLLSDIAAGTAQSIGTAFLADLVKTTRAAMDAQLVFITMGLGEPPRRARSVAAWERDRARDTFEYDLEGTPCEIVYRGQLLVVSQGLYRKFEKERPYEGYIGVPLKGSNGRVIGHFAILSQKSLMAPDEAAAIVRLFAVRAESELQRIEHERERDSLIASLALANRRLSRRHNALRQSNDVKTMLIGMLAHDLRNPLSVIVSRSELVQALVDRHDDDLMPKAQESCENIIAMAERMDRMIASALAQAREEFEKIVLSVGEFPVVRAIDAAIGLNSGAARAKAIELKQDVPPEISMRGDEDRIIEALDNLIRNAIKYSHRGQKVTVHAAASSDSIDLSVEDEGQGLTREDCTRAFRQFQRLSAKPTAGESSTGIGLAIVRAIAEAHGGTASVMSPGSGRGAAFTLSIPQAPLATGGA
jgi:signal transduction histidine kinase